MAKKNQISFMDDPLGGYRNANKVIQKHLPTPIIIICVRDLIKNRLQKFKDGQMIFCATLAAVNEHPAKTTKK